MIFDIPLRNSKGSFYIFFFSSKSLPFVCEYPQDNQTILLNIHLAWDKFLQIKSVDVFTIVGTLLS